MTVCLSAHSAGARIRVFFRTVSIQCDIDTVDSRIANNQTRLSVRYHCAVLYSTMHCSSTDTGHPTGSQQPHTHLHSRNLSASELKNRGVSLHMQQRASQLIVHTTLSSWFARKVAWVRDRHPPYSTFGTFSTSDETRRKLRDGMIGKREMPMGNDQKPDVVHTPRTAASLRMNPMKVHNVIVEVAE